MGRKADTAGRGPVMDRRCVLLCALGAAGALCAPALFGCAAKEDASDGGAAGADVTAAAPETSENAAHVAHQVAVRDGEDVLWVDFATGSLVRTSAQGVGHEVLYTNGQVNHLGIRYLVISGDEVFFCDAPTASIRVVPTQGGEARTVWTSESPAVLPLPLAVGSGRVYASLLDTDTMTSELFSVALDGSDARRHFSLPAGFYAQAADLAAGRAYYAGVNDADTRQVRSATLDGTDELVVFSLNGVPSASSAISWQLVGERLYVEAQDDASASNRLLSYALDGSDEQLVHDFSSQKVLFDYADGTLWFVDRETFTLMAAGLEEDAPAQIVGQVPKRAAGTAVSFLEAGGELAWVTTVTAGADTANEYVTYLGSLEGGDPVELA